MMGIVRAASLAAVVVGAAACVGENGDAIETGQTQQAAAMCGPWGCGYNSSEVGGMLMLGLREDFTEYEGFTITRVLHPRYPGRKFRVDVKSGRMTAFTIDGGPYVKVTNTSYPWRVAELQLEVKHVSGQVFTLQVYALNNKLAFLNVKYPGLGASYTMKYKLGPPSGSVDERFPFSLCSNPPPENEMGMNRFDTVVLEGDVIDPLRKEFVEDATTNADHNNLFSWGCAGHALAKAYLGRYTHATRPAGVPVPLDLKTAFIKSITADYCGTGKAFTAHGEPLVYRDGDAWMDFYLPPTHIEARWDRTGAVCLDEPRLADSVDPDVLAEFPDLELAIEAECKRPPKCNDIGLSEDPYVDEPGLSFVTGNY